MRFATMLRAEVTAGGLRLKPRDLCVLRPLGGNFDIAFVQWHHAHDPVAGAMVTWSS